MKKLLLTCALLIINTVPVCSAGTRTTILPQKEFIVVRLKGITPGSQTVALNTEMEFQIVTYPSGNYSLLDESSISVSGAVFISYNPLTGKAKVRFDQVSATGLDYKTVTATLGTSSVVSKTIVVKMDISMDVMAEENEDGSNKPHETDPGTVVLLNDNDNDGVKGIDKDRTSVLTQDDRDLKPIFLNCPTTLAAGTVTLDVPLGIKVWKDRKKNPTTLAWNLAAQTVPSTLYVEGISAGSADLELLYTSSAGEHGDIVKINVVKIEIVPDWNRDGVINDADRGKVTAANPWRFWINDDKDISYLIAQDNDVPNNGVDYGNWYTPIVDGKGDLIDFFPLYLDLDQALQLLPEADYKYVLKHDNSALAGFVSGLEYGSALSTTCANAYMRNLAVAEATVFSTPAAINPQGGFVLNDKGAFLSDIKNGNKGVVILEGCGPLPESGLIERSLLLEITRKTDEQTILTQEFPISLSGVEDMFRHKNLTGIANEPGFSVIGPEDRIYPPANYPDALTINKNFIFVHGYNVNDQEARGWQSEVFKRMFWSGSKAKFYTVTWYGWETKTGNCFTRNFHVNVVNALETFTQFKIFLSGLSGENIVAAHSLGNMVVSAAISYQAAPVREYFLIDAAVALECYQYTEEITRDMVHPYWDDFISPEYNRVLASEWYQLFPSSDKRSGLTWRGRFDNFPNTQYYNFHSSGEEVLARHPHDNNPQLTDVVYPIQGRFAWALQEKLKGRYWTNFVLGSDHNGWGFNQISDYGGIDDDGFWQPISSEQTIWITGEQLKTEPFFRKGPSNELFEPGLTGSNYVGNNYNLLLAGGFPATTLPAGLMAIPRLEARERNFDMQVQFKNGWPREDKPQWLHSDMKAIAYPYVYKLFDKFAELGGLR